MEFPEDQYYRLNRILLSVVGLWPYDNFIVRQLCFIVILIILLSYLIVQLLAVIVSKYEFNDILKMLCFYIIFVAIFMKYITFYTALKNIKQIRESVFDNWSILMDNYEIEIIRKHANVGKFFTLCIIMICSIVFIFAISLQYIPNLLDIIKPLNTSRPHEYFIQTEYFIDRQKYFHITAMHINIGMYILFTTMAATETFALVNAFYAFGLFKVTSYRMQHILRRFNPRTDINNTYVASWDRITAAVDMHRRAIEFSELLKESFGPMYLIFVAGLIISISINMFYLLQIITTIKKILESIICILFIIMQLIGFIAGNYVGQEFINGDMNVYRTICNTRWYNAPLKTQKLILFLIQKTTKCYKVDAAGMFYPSLEGLASGLSMSVSYFMLLCSI